jgi:deoxyribonuclease IV
MSYKIGFHVSISGGIPNSVDNALKIGCNAFQIFSRSPRGWAAKPLQEEDVKNFRKRLNDSKINRNSVFVHMPYLPNLSSPNNRLHKKSTNILTEEVSRSAALGIHFIVLHLGSHGGKGSNTGISQLVKACNFAIENYYKLLPTTTVTTSTTKNKKKGSNNESSIDINENEYVTIILENSAGEKNSIGSRFDELGLIIEKLLNSSSKRKSFGICLDTCHAFAAGYDLRTEDAINETLDEFKSKVGLKNLKVIHLNDSKDKLNSNRDRHEHIGLGKIGKEGFRELLKHKAVKRLPIIMETPLDKRRNDSDNLKVVLDLLNNKKGRRKNSYY